MSCILGFRKCLRCVSTVRMFPLHQIVSNEELFLNELKPILTEGIRKECSRADLVDRLDVAPDRRPIIFGGIDLAAFERANLNQSYEDVIHF